MLGFTYYTPTKVAFGKGSVERVGELMKQFGGTRVLIHYGGQSAVRSGVLDRVKKSLDEAGIFHVELGGVVPNPHLAKVREGIEPVSYTHLDVYKRQICSFTIWYLAGF